MQSKSKFMSMLVLLFAVVFVFGAVFMGVNQAKEASALGEDTAAVEALASESPKQAAEEENNGYSVFYFIMDGVTATSLLGIAVTEGWQMALWLSMVYWILAVVASILMVLFSKLFVSKDDEKPFNTIALLGLIWSFFMPIAGFMLSMVGKRQAATHEGGKFYYIGGLIVSSIFFGIAIILALVEACVPFLPF